MMDTLGKQIQEYKDIQEDALKRKREIEKACANKMKQFKELVRQVIQEHEENARIFLAPNNDQDLVEGCHQNAGQ